MNCVEPIELKLPCWRRIVPGRYEMVTMDAIEDPVAALMTHAGVNEFVLLAHVLDGVLWGRTRDGAFVFAPARWDWRAPALRVETLLQARLFNKDSELFVWRTGPACFRARTITDGAGDVVEQYDEQCLLWGTEVESSSDGFYLLRHGAEGLRHAPPVNAQADWRPAVSPLHLTVRHYIADQANTHVFASRLAGLSISGARQP